MSAVAGEAHFLHRYEVQHDLEGGLAPSTAEDTEPSPLS